MIKTVTLELSPDDACRLYGEACDEADHAMERFVRNQTAVAAAESTFWHTLKSQLAEQLGIDFHNRPALPIPGAGYESTAIKTT
jgi:hypothetical protein